MNNHFENMTNNIVKILNRSANKTNPIVSFSLDKTGVSAVEFALVLPVMLMIFVGMTELSRALDTWRKIEATSRAIADLTSQGDTQSPMRSSTMTDIMASAKLVMRPFDSKTAKIVVSALGVDLTNFSLTKPKICSSFASSNTSARPIGMGSDLTIPDGFRTQGARYIYVEVAMPYTPIIGNALLNFVGFDAGSINLTSKNSWPQRTEKEVVLPSGNTCL